MDGLTISNAENLLKTGDTASEMRAKQFAPKADGTGNEKGTFANTLKDAINNVNTLQKEADVAIQNLATGKSKNIPEVMIAVEKADIALKLMVQVRNKMIDAYQQTMKMQV